MPVRTRRNAPVGAIIVGEVKVNESNRFPGIRGPIYSVVRQQRVANTIIDALVREPLAPASASYGDYEAPMHPCECHLREGSRPSPDYHEGGRLADQQIAAVVEASAEGNVHELVGRGKVGSGEETNDVAGAPSGAASRSARSSFHHAAQSAGEYPVPTIDQALTNFLGDTPAHAGRVGRGVPNDRDQRFHGDHLDGLAMMRPITSSRRDAALPLSAPEGSYR